MLASRHMEAASAHLTCEHYLQPDPALAEAPARAGTPLAAGLTPAAPAAVGRSAPYQGAWNKCKTGIPEKDIEILYECMAEIGGRPRTHLMISELPSRTLSAASGHSGFASG